MKHVREGANETPLHFAFFFHSCEWERLAEMTPSFQLHRVCMQCQTHSCLRSHFNFPYCFGLSSCLCIQ
jgi:hypothetical protein